MQFNSRGGERAHIYVKALKNRPDGMIIALSRVVKLESQYSLQR